MRDIAWQKSSRCMCGHGHGGRAKEVDVMMVGESRDHDCD